MSIAPVTRRSLLVRAVFAVVASAAWLGQASIAHAQLGVPIIELKSRNGGQGSIVGRASDAPGQQLNFTFTSPPHRFFRNDEARSVILYNVRPGARITLFDNSRGDQRDDWVEIIVVGNARTPVTGLVLPTFEATYRVPYPGGYVQVVYHRHNGLDGKVSRMHIQ